MIFNEGIHAFTRLNRIDVQKVRVNANGRCICIHGVFGKVIAGQTHVNCHLLPHREHRLRCHLLCEHTRVLRLIRIGGRHWRNKNRNHRHEGKRNNRKRSSKARRGKACERSSYEKLRCACFF